MKERQVHLVQICGLMHPQAALAARLQGLPVVWQLLSDFAPLPLRAALMPLVKRWADVVMTTGLATARAHPGWKGLGTRLIPFYPPVDTNCFTSSTNRRSSVRESLGVPPNAILVGTVGNRNRMKGHDLLVEAVSLARSRCPSIRLFILGAPTPGQEDYYESKVIGRASLLGMLDTEYLQFLSDVLPSEFLQALDIFVLSSRAEGLPTSLLEAMSAGLPAVSTRVGSVGEAIVQGETGELVGKEDVQGLASAIVKLAESSDLRVHYGEAGRSRAQALFDVRECVNVHLKAYNMALASSTKA